jgi:hypothetical protein
MAAWVVWGIFVGVAALLGFVGYHFSVRSLRWVAVITALGLAWAITAYGLRHTAPKPSNLQSSFALGADRVAAAFFDQLGRGNPLFGLGRVGWVVIIILLVLGYRMIEAWALHWQAPQLDVSKVGDGQPSIKPRVAQGELVDGLTDGQRHAQLAAALKFRLAAMEVRAPAILPGGSRSGGLASIAEASGVGGAGLAGAIIRFFGMLWPNPRQVQLLVWVEPTSKGTDAEAAKPAPFTRVTVELSNSRTGETISTQTLAAATIDEAATSLAGYVARQIFDMDPGAPPWCIGNPDGSDLSALLRNRLKRDDVSTRERMASSRSLQIKLLKSAGASSRCAGVVRYELAQLYSIQGDPHEKHPTNQEHLTALRLHALNREQYPRFYRGRYRLGMSLEMVANPEFRFRFAKRKEAMDELNEILAILRRCRLTTKRQCEEGDIMSASGDDGNDEGFHLSPALCLELLEAAQVEFRGVRRQLTIWRVLWAAFVHRDERAIWKPYLSGLRLRQSFHDCTCVAELLVAVRRRQSEARLSEARLSEAEPKKTKPKQDPLKPRHLRLAIRVSSAIAGKDRLIRSIVKQPGRQWPPPATDKPVPDDLRDRLRWLPWLRRTASWQAAYNTACLYAALASESPALEACEDRVVASLRRVVNNPYSEMERPSDWIARDPDFSALSSSPEKKFPFFKKFLEDQQRMDYPTPDADADASDTEVSRV